MFNFKTTYIKYSKIVNCMNLGSQKLVNFVNEQGVSVDRFDVTGIPPKQTHVAVLGGGMSAEREVSYMSSNGIVRSIISLGHYVTFIDMGADIASVLATLKPDVVFNALHGTYGEDGCVPGMLNIMRIPYTGCGVRASALAFNKRKSNQIFIANNIKVPKSIIVCKKDNIKSDPMPRPYVIKPLAEGSSIGVEIIFAGDEFNFADYEFSYGDKIIVEEYIAGREMQVAVLNGKAIGVLEIKLLKGKRFYDYEAKYTEGFAKHLLPAPVEKKVYDELLDTAEKACAVFDASGMVRVEILYREETGECFMLEINTHPGMTPLSICPEIAAYNGISYTRLVDMILKNANFEK